MAEITLKAQAGRTTGTRPTGRLRHEGRIPGIIYGHGVSPLPVSVDGRELRAALTTDAGLNALLALQLDDATHLTMARELQRHPVRNTITHIDFLIVRRDEIVSADVPVNLVGEAELVNRYDGVVDQQLHSITVHATPDKIPSTIDVDISGLRIGDAVRISDLRLPEGVSTELDPEEAIVIASASSTSTEVEEADEAVAEAAAEAASGEGEAEGGDGAEAAASDDAEG